MNSLNKNRTENPVFYKGRLISAHLFNLANYKGGNYEKL